MNIPNQKKKKIDVSVESMKDLMQETYNEIVDERNKAITAYKKFSKDINENSDIALVGKITNDLLKIIKRVIKEQGEEAQANKVIQCFLNKKGIMQHFCIISSIFTFG